MNWRKKFAAERTVTIVGCIALASSGVYAFLLAGLCRLLFELNENWALLWIGVPSFTVLLVLHIRMLPRYLRKAGFIE
jgi:hypothetical protein